MKFFDKRPVKCVFCKKPMYYAEHPDCEPEYQIIIEEGFDNQVVPTIYCHQRCLPKILLEAEDVYDEVEEIEEGKNSETSPTKM